jgi:hypothetical protein
VKVRIKTVPVEREMDGVNLDRMQPGSIREVSVPIGAWLIAQGYADLEMRRESSSSDAAPSGSDGSPRVERRRRR